MSGRIWCDVCEENLPAEAKADHEHGRGTPTEGDRKLVASFLSDEYEAAWTNRGAISIQTEKRRGVNRGTRENPKWVSRPKYVVTELHTQHDVEVYLGGQASV